MMFRYRGRTARFILQDGTTIEGRVRPLWFMFWAFRVTGAAVLDHVGAGSAAAGEIIIPRRTVRFIQVLPSEGED